MKRIFLIEDDQAIAKNLMLLLQSEGFIVTHAATRKEATDTLVDNKFDLALIDISLPDGNGFTVCTEVKEVQNIPVIFLTASGDEASVVTGLNMGADDYITKPFGTDELLARIRTALRHSQLPGSPGGSPESVYKSGDLVINFDKRLVTVGGTDIHLTQIEYKLVSLLAQNAGRVLTYDYIINQIWGPYADSNNQILRVNMAHIRRKMEASPAEPKYISTEIGVGYRMKESD